MGREDISRTHAGSQAQSRGTAAVILIGLPRMVQSSHEARGCTRSPLGTIAAQQAVGADGRALSRVSAPPSRPWLKYHALARCYLMPSGFLMRRLLNGGTLGGRNLTPA